MLFVGADISTRKISLAGVSPDDEWCFVEIPISESAVRGRYLRRDLHEEIGSDFWDQVGCVWIEEPFLLRGKRANPQTYGKLSCVMGALGAAVPERVSVSTIDPYTWRSEFGWQGLKRAEAKQAAWRWAEDQGLPTDKISVDLAEAACIAWTCLQQSGRAS